MIDTDLGEEENEGPPSAIESFCVQDRGDFVNIRGDSRKDPRTRQNVLPIELVEARIFLELIYRPETETFVTDIDDPW